MNIESYNYRRHADFAIKAAIFLAAIFVLYAAWHRNIDPDEMETLSAAGFIFDGKIPYRDFWQIHTPLAYVFFAPLCFFFKTINIFYAALVVTCLLLLFNGYLLFLIAKRLFSANAAAFTLLAYFVCRPVITKMVEVRPDALVMIFVNLSLLFLLETKLSSKKAFFLAGVFNALAFLTKQSGIVFTLGLLCFFVARTMLPKSRSEGSGIFSDARFNLKNYYFFFAGLFIPCSIFIAALFSLGALERFLMSAVNNDFLQGALFLSTGSGRFFPFKYLRDIFLCNFMLFFSCVLLPFYFYYKKRQDNSLFNACFLIFILFFVSSFSLFFILQPWEHDCLLFCQYLVLLAGPASLFIYERSRNLYFKKNKKMVWVVLVFFMLPILTAFARTCDPGGANKITLKRISKGLKITGMILALTNKEDKCLSLFAPCFLRSSAYRYSFHGPPVDAYLQTPKWESIFIKELLSGRFVVVVPLAFSNRIWMPQLRKVIQENYLLYKKLFYVPGTILHTGEAGAQINSEITFDILVGGYYKMRGDWEEIGGIRVDNQSLKTEILYLNKGKHSAYLPNMQKTYALVYDFQANKSQGQLLKPYQK